MTEKDQITTVLEQVDKAGIAMLVTTEDDGRIVSRPMAVQEVAAGDVEPMSHPSSLSGVMREDVVKPTLTAEQALDQAPSVEDQRFEVPQILGEEE